MEWRWTGAPGEQAAHDEGTINEGARKFRRNIFCTCIPKRVLERVQGCCNIYLVTSLPPADDYLNRNELLNEALEHHFCNISSVINETPTGVHSDDEAADDEHLKRLGRLPQGHQQSSHYCKAVVGKQGSSSAGSKEM